MSTARHTDAHHAFGAPAMTGGHDEGIEHSHNWARGAIGLRRHGPLVADPAAIPTPSSAVHDDALYGIG